MPTASRLHAALVALSIAALAPQAAAQAVINIPINNIDSGDLLGSGFNPVLIITLPAASAVTRIGWNLKQTAYTPSWLSEMAIQLSDSPVTSAFSIRPSSTGASGTELNILALTSLSSLGIPNLLLPNGQLRLEFYETFDDFPLGPDGIWAGTIPITGEVESYITIEYIPTPTTLAPFTLAALTLTRRRRA